MTAAGQSTRDQARLWLAAFGISAALNALILLAFGMEVISDLVFSPARRVAGELARTVSPPESVAIIMPEVASVQAAPAPAVAPAEPEKTSGAPFARTSVDQESEAPEKPSFIGERNTRATSDLAAEPDAPALPNQEGEEPDDEGEMETTMSRYQDGDLAHDRIARPDGPRPPSNLAPGPDAPEPMRREATTATKPPPPPLPGREKQNLLEGPFPVEREMREGPPEKQQQVRREEPTPPEETKAEPPKEELPKEAETKRETTAKDQPGKDTPPTRPAPTRPQNDPGFRGYQYKHRIHGSISRQGRSALDVEDSVLGRYHAALSRAVEREWQLNCVRNRDYITPGQIIVRFVLESNGKVRSVNFVEEFGVGNIQKGFTSQSIRSADIPPFPAEMKRELGGEPLEVTYSFTF